MDFDDSTQALWAEAAAAVQADDDADVRHEARGLAVAEMADVTFAERVQAMPIGSDVKVAVLDHGWMSGGLVCRGTDFLIVRARRDVLIPTHAIVAVTLLPRVLHAEPPAGTVPRARTWRSLLRELLGETIGICAPGFEQAGRLTWVGADHLSIEGQRRAEHSDASADDVTIPWMRTHSVTLPPMWEHLTALR